MGSTGNFRTILVQGGGDKEAIAQMALIEPLMNALEAGRPARTAVPKGEDEAAARLQLMTTKPVLYVCNVEEASAGAGNAHSARVQEMAKAQDELAKEVVEASVGGGTVKVKASGAGEIVEITIAPDVIDPEDPEGLADLVLAGVNQALKNSQDLMQSKLGGAMGDLKGLGLPGL